MIPGLHYLSCLVFAFWPVSASAQPLFRCENNWTVTVGDQLYGLREVVMMPGEKRWTQVWIGPYTIDMNCRAAEAIALVVLAPTDRLEKLWFLVNWSSLRRLP
jgi:hypothetical protein